MAHNTPSIVSDVFAISSLLVISLLVLLLLRHYLPLRTTPGYLLVPVFLALALPCSIILLVPIDLASAGGGSSRGVWLPERVVLAVWRITYWLTFLLTWWLLPLLGEYCDSGYRDTKSRVLYSLRENARYHLMVLGVSVAGLVYFVLQNGFGGASVKGLVMALAYAWGLILAIGLMGHGLVALPRRLFRNASVAGRLRGLQMLAPKIYDRRNEAIENLEQLENNARQLKQRKNGAGRDLQEWIDELADTRAGPVSRPGAAAAVRATNQAIPAVVTERYLADITRKLKRARHKRARFDMEWQSLCLKAQDAQTILDSASSKQLDVRPGDEGEILGRLKFITPSMRYQLHASILPRLRLALSACFASASIMVIWSEVVRSFAPSVSLVNLTVVHHSNRNGDAIGLGGQIIAAAWLLYMNACALYAISDVTVWGNRALVKRNTYAESACWYSLQVAKLTVPLSYNFITMLRADVYKQSAFFKFLGQLINLTPLGKGFSLFFPCFLLIPVLATAFNLYGKAKKILGFGILEDETELNPSGLGTGGWREGKALIDRELLARGVSSGGGGGGGSGQSHLSLADRSALLDIESQADTSTPPPPSSTSASAPIPEANQHFNSITNELENNDTSTRHFYQDFSERVRNTLDTADRPEWVRSLGQGFKTPKWMVGGSRDGSGNASGEGSVLGKWFGARPEGGRLRL